MPEGALYVPDVPNDREGPQASEPSKCLNGWSYRERLAKRPSDRSYNRLEKRLPRGHNSCGRGSPCPCTLGTTRVPTAKKLHHFHAQSSLGQSCHKESLVSMHVGSLRWCPTLGDSVDCGLPGFSVRRLLQAKILERVRLYWLPYPSRALYFLPP